MSTSYATSAKNTLYFASRLTNTPERYIIGANTESDKVDPYDPGETPEQTQSRMPLERFKEINHLLRSAPEPICFDRDEMEIGDTHSLRAFVAPLVETGRTRFLSPYISDFSSGGEAKIFSNIDLVLVPADSDEDISGAYYTYDDEEVVVLTRIGECDGYGSFERVNIDVDTDEGFEAIRQVLSHVVAQIQQSMLARCDGLRLFIMGEEWSSREDHDRDCLPDGIHFSKSGDRVTASAPGFISIQSSMHDEGIRLAYFKSIWLLAQWLGLAPEQIDFRLTFPYELSGFQVGEHVWLEALYGDTPKRIAHLDRFWFNQPALQTLAQQQHSPRTIASWLATEGVTAVSYFSFVEHDAGDDVAYSVAAFKGRKRILTFMLSLFSRAGNEWMDEFSEALSDFGIPCIHAGEKEEDWDLVAFNDEFFFVLPSAPTVAAEKFSILGLYLVCGDGVALNGDVTMRNIQEFPELLSLGLNGPLSITGAISSPLYVQTEDLIEPLKKNEQLVTEALEDGLSLTDPLVANKLKFEQSVNIQSPTGLAVLCTLVLNITANEMLDYLTSGDLPAGELQSPALLTRLNTWFPEAKISKAVLVPYVKELG